MKISNDNKLMLRVWFDGLNGWQWVYLHDGLLYVRDLLGEWDLLSNHHIDKISACGNVELTKQVVLSAFVDIDL